MLAPAGHETNSSGKVVFKVIVPVSRTQEANGRQQGEGRSSGQLKPLRQMSSFLWSFK